MDEIIHLQKLVRAQNQVHNELINHLNKVEQERKEKRNAGHPSGYTSNTANLLSDGSESPPELRRARDILNGLQVDHVADRDLNRMSIQLHQAGGSPESAGSSGMMGPPGAGNVNPFLHDPLNDMRHLVYPVGQTIGIDPFAAEHINNLPYNRPMQDNAVGPNHEFNGPPMHSHTPPGAAAQGGSPWGSKKPVVLLVEDDRTCSRIGSKFLSQYDCGVEVAVSIRSAGSSIRKAHSWLTSLITARWSGSCEQSQREAALL